MENKNFSFSFETDEPSMEVFKTLSDPNKWWSGLFGEEIKGESKKINDEFTFSAGDGVHYSKQRLVELTPGKKINWLVTESSLSFLKKKDEWNGTKFGFEISKRGDNNLVTFTHEGLVPKIECFDRCTGAWSQYLGKLAARYKHEVKR